MKKIIDINKKYEIKKKYNNIDCSNTILSDLNSKFSNCNQLIFINKLYLNENFFEKKELIINLNNKINSYKQQDIKRKLHNKDTIIKFDELVEKLLLSKLKCYFNFS